MKKILLIFCLSLFSIGFAAAGGGGESTAAQAVNRTMYVAVNTADLKASAGAFAAAVGTLKYGDRVTVLQISGRFMQVRSDTNTSLSGWIPEANLSARQIVPGTTGTATAGEVAMAARGFNQEVEQNYRTQNTNLNYIDVDRIEAVSITDNELMQFLEEGRLVMGDN